MRSCSLLLATVWSLSAAAAAAADGRGLTVDAEQLGWPQWQARLQLAAEPVSPLSTASEGLTAMRPRSAALFGDYFMARPYFGQAGGLRLTSGVVMGPRGGLFGTGQAATGGPFTVSAVGRSSLTSLASVDGSGDAVSAWPYLGIGYSDSSLRGGFSFSADLGLAVPGQSVLRAARSLGSQPLDDMLRDLRLTPVLQLGVSYRF
jgi:hypothetical protein